MATRPVVPRATGEGSIGTAAKHWGNGYFDELNTEKVVADDVVAKGPVVDVRAFGAKGDGVTDDTAAFQAASATGSAVIIPSGNYVINTGIVFNNVVSDNGIYTNLKPAYKNNDVLMTDLGNCYKVGKVPYGTDFAGGNQQGAAYNSKTNEILLFIGRNNFATQHILCVNPSNYTITRSAAYTTLGHGNTLEYNEDLEKIYIPSSNNDIHIINATSLEIEGTLALPGITAGTLFAFKYDKVTGCWVALIHNAPYININVYNKNFELIKQSILTLPESQEVNGCAVYNGNVLLATWTHFIQFDIFGELKKYIGGLKTRQEPEDFYYIGNNLYYAINTASDTPIWQINEYKQDGEMGDNPYNIIGSTGVGLNNTDLNSITKAGCYGVNTNDANSHHFPDGAVNGFLLVYVYPNFTIKQVFHRIGSLNSTDKYVYVRTYHQMLNSWSDWVLLTTPIAEYNVINETARTEFTGSAYQKTMEYTIPKGYAYSLSYIEEFSNSPVYGIKVSSIDDESKYVQIIERVSASSSLVLPLNGYATEDTTLYFFAKHGGASGNTHYLRGFLIKKQ